jgi:hypothetical protein
MYGASTVLCLCSYAIAQSDNRAQVDLTADHLEGSRGTDMDMNGRQSDSRLVVTMVRYYKHFNPTSNNLTLL